MTWQDVGALLIVLGVFIGLLYLFADAIDADAAFSASRIAAHQAECLAAQAAAQ